MKLRFNTYMPSDSSKHENPHWWLEISGDFSEDPVDAIEVLKRASKSVTALKAEPGNN